MGTTEIFILTILIISIILIILYERNNKKKSGTEKPIENKPKRRYIKDVKPGEYVKIEWHRIGEDGIGSLKCLNNDQVSKKILLEVHWNDSRGKGVPEYEKIIFDYNDKELKDFNLLNQLSLPITKGGDDDDNNLSALQKK